MNNVKIKRGMVVVFFLLFLLYGRIAYNDYGLSWDEGIERDSSLVTYGYIVPSVKDSITETVNFETYPEYHEYRDRYYGMAAQLPMVWMEHMQDFEMSYYEIYMMRHAYTFLMFFIAAIYFYRICKIFTKDPLVALMGVLFLILSPRILADSFYNIKDSIGVSWCIISSYYALKFIERPNTKNTLLLAFTGAFFTNVRIVGAFVLVFAVALVFLKSILEKRMKQVVPMLAVLCVGSILIYIVLSPAVWSNPIKGLLETIRVFSSYTTYDVPITFMGNVYAPGTLPWYYLPVWILVTIPVITLVVCAFGYGRQMKSMLVCLTGKKHVSEEGWKKLYMALMLVVPMLYVFIASPVLYNGWRHFYFIYPFLAFGAFLGILAGGKWIKGVALFGFVLVALWIVKNHPYEYVYFNPLVKGRIEHNFEKDYYAVSQKDALQYICQIEDRSNINVWMYGPNICRYLLHPNDVARINPVSSEELADYLVYPHTKCAGQTEPDQAQMFEVIHEIEVDGEVICSIYKKKYELSLECFIREHADLGESRYSIGNIDWSARETADGICWLGKLVKSEKFAMGKVTWEEDGKQETSLEFSEDGESWSEVPESGSQYVRFFHEKNFTEEEFRVAFYQTPEAAAELEKIQPIAKASTGENEGQASFAFDQNIVTRWELGAMQEPGSEFIIEVKAGYEVAAACLDLSGSVWDYPRNLEIYASNNKTTWEQIEILEIDDNEYFEFEEGGYRYLKFRLGEQTESVDSGWSIYEIRLFKKTAQ